MEDKDKSNVEVETLAPERTVQEYLNTLLQDATSFAASEVLPQVETQLETEVSTQTETEVKTEAPVEIVADVAEPVVVAKAPVEEPVVEVHTETHAEVQTETQPALSVVGKTEVMVAPVEAEQAQAREWQHGRPPWAQESFDCLLFNVAGLTLAVPLAELGGVLPIDTDLTPLFGQPNWYLGLLPSKTAGTVKVVDTARWVMPEKYTDAAREGLKFVIRIEGSDWGMACHDVAEAISLTPDQVRWRSDRGRRPWLAGTVVEHMCAILDVAALVYLTDTGQRDGAIS